MARFYARFDSGSAGWTTELDSGVPSVFFDRRLIPAGCASAALLRDGLIASRSALSIDIYEDLDSVNKDGSKGIYFPPDSGPFSTNTSTFVSWSTAYTSSVPGLVTPVTNSYGSATGVNYSLRPTASIVSTQTTLVGPTNPEDSVGASYTTYITASAADNAILGVVQNGSAVVNTPFSRLGVKPSRTLHSIWHDPNLQYFAWDDFTPGLLPKPSLSVLGIGPAAASLDLSWATPEYANDKNTSAPIFLQISLAPTNSEPAPGDRGQCTRTLSIPSGSVFLGTNTSSLSGPPNCQGGGSSSWEWTADTLTWTIDTGGGEHRYEGYFRIHDPIIQTHVSSSFADFIDYDTGEAPAGDPPAPDPIDYCVESCESFLYEADHPDCGGDCPNCDVGLCVDY
jgi:hypothetical protein